MANEQIISKVKLPNIDEPYYIKDTVSGYIDNVSDQIIDGQKDFTINPRMLVHGHPEDIVITNPDYEQIEYIENIYPKHAYIDTGFRLNQNSKIEISYSIQKSFSVGMSFAVCGARASKTSNAFNLWGSLSDGPIGANFGNLGAISSSIMPEVNAVYNISLDKNSLIINDQITSLSSTPNFTTPANCWLFDFYGSNTTSGSTGNVYLWGRIYQCKIYDDGTLARNLYPCYRKLDGMAGMYDIVNDVFYPSQTTDLFQAGPELKDRYENLLTDANFADVAFSGNYNDLQNRPTIPTVYNGTLTIKQNNTSVGTFTANSSASPSINITVPTTVAELTDKDNYATVEYVDDEIQDVREVAEGKTATYVCSAETNPILNSLDDTITINSTLTDINGNVLQLDIFKIGDNIYIPQTDIPDRWVMSKTSSSIIVSRLETAKNSVNDVQINGTSIVDNSIANITGLATDTEVVHNTGNEVINGQKDFNTVPRLWVSREEEIVVPEGYTQLEYISADGNEYVSTGIVGNLNTKFKLIAAPATHSTVIFGSRSSATSNNVSCLVGPTNDNVVDFGNYNITRAVATISNSIYVKIEYYNSKDRRYMKNVATDIILAENTTPFTTQITTPTELYFGYYGAGAFPSGDTNFIGYYYSCEIYDDETLIANFVPAKENATGKVGFYDTVRNIFLSSIGPSEYIAGPIIESRYENLLTNGNFSTVAFTGDYFDLANKPSIPTVYNNTLTIQQNGTTVQTFTANSDINKMANIVVPTKLSELTQDVELGKVDDVQVNGASVVINKIADIAVPTKVSELENDSGFINDITSTEIELEEVD